MLTFTDCPEEANRLGVGDDGWREQPIQTLAEPDRNVCTALIPDPVIWSSRAARGAWGDALSRLIVVRDASSSQFDTLLQHLRSGTVLPEGVAALALQGQNFHGHHGRDWRALYGNLHLSVYYAPGRAARDLGMGLTMLPAVATVDAIKVLYGETVPVGIKWVNDIELAHKKISGVLTTTQTRGNMIEHVVLGIGLNVGCAPEIEPTPFVPASGCLHDLLPHSDMPPGRVLTALLKALNRRYIDLLRDGPRPVFDAYRRYAHCIGRRVRIWEDRRDIRMDRPHEHAVLAHGMLRGLNPDLSLVIEGVDAPVTKGRLAYEEVCAALAF